MRYNNQPIWEARESRNSKRASTCSLIRIAAQPRFPSPPRSLATKNLQSNHPLSPRRQSFPLLKPHKASRSKAATWAEYRYLSSNRWSLVRKRCRSHPESSKSTTSRSIRTTYLGNGTKKQITKEEVHHLTYHDKPIELSWLQKNARGEWLRMYPHRKWATQTSISV